MSMIGPRDVWSGGPPGGRNRPTARDGGGPSRLAAAVVAGAGRQDHAVVDDLIAHLSEHELRALVRDLAPRAVQAALKPSMHGPAGICELAINAAAQMFGVTPDEVRGSQRSAPISDARAVAMTAARGNGLSLPSIAREFDKNHGSVIHAVRRTEQRPRLADAAARVAQHVADHYTELPAGGFPPNAGHEQSALLQTSRSEFQPTGIIERAVVAAARAFATTPEQLLGADRTRAIGDARGVAMTAARLRGQSLPRIARHFDRDHTTVLQTTRRIEQTPPLRDLATAIARDLPDATPAINGVAATTRATTGATVRSAGAVSMAGGTGVEVDVDDADVVDQARSENRGSQEGRRAGATLHPGQQGGERHLRVAQ